MIVDQSTPSSNKENKKMYDAYITYSIKDVTSSKRKFLVLSNNTGACIHLANKHNSKIDCVDKLDESQCTYLEVPSNYVSQL